MYHKSVLLSESVDGLIVDPNGVYVDVTFGGGGHSREVLSRLGEGCLVAFDQDEDALVNEIEDERLLLLHNNFRYMAKFLRLHGFRRVDGVLADLGISSYQIDQGERGFSIRFNAELDMRMDRRREITARDIVNDYSEQELYSILKKYGELSNTGKVVSSIVKARADKAIVYVDDLKEALGGCFVASQEYKFFAKVFQALRIEVNQEMQALEEMLEQSLTVLKNGGRLVVISYHSLEDRMVKNFMKTGNLLGEVKKDFYGNNLSPFRLVTRKVVVPTDEELRLNNRARSAKLRIAEKIIESE